MDIQLFNINFDVFLIYLFIYFVYNNFKQQFIYIFVVIASRYYWLINCIHLLKVVSMYDAYATYYNIIQ